MNQIKKKSSTDPYYIPSSSRYLGWLQKSQRPVKVWLYEPSCGLQDSTKKETGLEYKKRGQDEELVALQCANTTVESSQYSSLRSVNIPIFGQNDFELTW
jgi:hypothetical protein